MLSGVPLAMVDWVDVTLIALVSVVVSLLVALLLFYCECCLVTSQIDSAHPVSGGLYEGAQLDYAAYKQFTNGPSNQIKAFVCDVCRAIAIQRNGVSKPEPELLFDALHAVGVNPEGSPPLLTSAVARSIAKEVGRIMMENTMPVVTPTCCAACGYIRRFRYDLGSLRPEMKRKVIVELVKNGLSDVQVGGWESCFASTQACVSSALSLVFCVDQPTNGRRTCCVWSCCPTCIQSCLFCPCQ